MSSIQQVWRASAAGLLLFAFVGFSNGVVRGEYPTPAVPHRADWEEELQAADEAVRLNTDSARVYLSRGGRRLFREL